MDETYPQTTANTQRVWSLSNSFGVKKFTKPSIIKNSTHMRANTFGFYSINGNNVIDFKEHSKKDDVCEFLEHIRRDSPGKNIILIMDNFRLHWANKTRKKAKDLDTF